MLENESYTLVEIMLYHEWTYSLDKEMDKLNEQICIYESLLENCTNERDIKWYDSRLSYLIESVERYSHIRRTALVEKDYAIFYREYGVLGWNHANVDERKQVYSREMSRRRMIV